MTFNLLVKTITASQVWGKAWPILLAILFFGLIIAIHELGHFATAKLFGVKVNEFAIGMGPTILKKRRGETQYSLRLFPIGGFVQMEGENEESEDERAFCRKKARQRFIIVAAGAINNLILGLIFVIIITSMSDLVGTTQIHSFDQNAVSSSYGLQTGDYIREINGTNIYSDRDISYCMARDDDGIYDITVERDGEKLLLKDVHFAYEENEDGKNLIIFDFILVGKQKTFFNVIGASFRDTISIARLVWLTIFDLITGHFGINDISGPVGTVSIIAQVADEAVKPGGAGLEMILYVMALITVNIGVFNLLPIPALDGGRLFFILIEMIFRKPVPAKYENWIHAAGLALLLAFMAFITFNDIKNLIIK